MWAQKREGGAGGGRQRLGAALLLRMRGFLEQFLEGSYNILMGQVGGRKVALGAFFLGQGVMLGIVLYCNSAQQSGAPPTSHQHQH